MPVLNPICYYCGLEKQYGWTLIRGQIVFYFCSWDCLNDWEKMMETKKRDVAVAVVGILLAIALILGGYFVRVFG